MTTLPTEGNSLTFVATSHSNQIKQFYEEDENTRWLTFYATNFGGVSKPEITLLNYPCKQADNG